MKKNKIEKLIFSEDEPSVEVGSLSGYIDKYVYRDKAEPVTYNIETKEGLEGNAGFFACCPVEYGEDLIKILQILEKKKTGRLSREEVRISFREKLKYIEFHIQVSIFPFSWTFDIKATKSPVRLWIEIGPVRIYVALRKNLYE